MKTPAILMAVPFAVLSLASQDTVSLARKYVEGDKDTYKLALQMTISESNVDMSMTSTRVVKKVFDNGDADIEDVVSGLKMSIDGHTVSPPAPKPETTRYSRAGIPLSAKKAAQGMAFLKFVNWVTDKPLKVGETVVVDYPDPDDPKSRVTGTIRLESVDKSDAKLISVLESTTSTSKDKPMKMAFTTWFDLATCKPNRITGTISNLAGPQGLPIDGVQLTMERVK
jgi:hypothetical protein